jgi:hypothetical protein
MLNREPTSKTIREGLRVTEVSSQWMDSRLYVVSSSEVLHKNQEWDYAEIKYQGQERMGKHGQMGKEDWGGEFSWRSIKAIELCLIRGVELALLDPPCRATLSKRVETMFLPLFVYKRKGLGLFLQ